MEHTRELKKKNRFTPGFDKMTPEALLTWLQMNGEKLCRELNSGKYKPMPASGFYVAKSDGGYRPLVRLTVLDAVIQNILLEELEERCSAVFSDYSFAYRKGFGVNKALQQFCEYAFSFPYAARLDIKKCFDSIDFDILECALNGLFDKATSGLLLSQAKMPVVNEGIISERKNGILQGAPLSGLFCNIYLDKLDKEAEKDGVVFIRYADDIVVFEKSEKAAAQKAAWISDFLCRELRLKTNDKKIRITASENAVFLGYKFARDKNGLVTVNTSRQISSAYYDWFSSRPANGKNSVDLLSDGILRQKDFSAVFDSETGSSVIPLETTDRINIFSSVIIDTGFLEKAKQAGISVNVFGRDYSFIGRFTPAGNIRDQRLLFEQLTAYNTPEKRLELAKQFDLASVHNLRLNIRYYNKQDPNALYMRTLEYIDVLFDKMKECSEYENLLLIEATVRSLYYSCFDSFIADSEYTFEKRSKRPPENEVNSMLSFGNTVLYNYIATEIYKSSLDIRVGFLHATNKREESLNLDVAEIFRPLIVDRVVFTLINKRSIPRSCFYREENGAVYLNEDGKRIFLRAFYEKLSSTLSVGDKNYSYSMLIKEELNKLTRYFRTGGKYKAYRQVR